MSSALPSIFPERRRWKLEQLTAGKEEAVCRTLQYLSTSHGQRVAATRRCRLESMAGPELAVGYMRTSAANVTSDKNSGPRQKEAILRFAKAMNTKVPKIFYDAAVLKEASVAHGFSALC